MKLKVVIHDAEEGGYWAEVRNCSPDLGSRMTNS